MKVFHRKPSANFPQTPVWGVTATRWAVCFYFGLHSVVVELPQRKLTKRGLDLGYESRMAERNPQEWRKAVEGSWDDRPNQ